VFVVKRKAFVLVVVLLLSVIITLLGMAFVGSRAVLYRGVSLVGEQAMARSFAESGLEDARVKLNKDFAFPPPGREEQKTFSYSEDMVDSSGTLLGYYEVKIDMEYAVAPYSILRLSSIGRVGPREEPFAEHVIEAELDISETDRTNTSAPNPRYFEYIRYLHGNRG
jgi:type II secretory pathway component PulK